MTGSQEATLRSLWDQDGYDDTLAVLVAWLLEARPESTDAHVKLMVERAVDEALWRRVPA